MGTRLIVLGSGQDGGTPQVGGPFPDGPDRSASSVAIVTDEVTLLFDASPDIREQYRRLAIARGDAGADRRARPFDAVFITHAHMGHYAGLVHLGKEAASTSSIPLVADASVLSYLGENEPWASLVHNGNVEHRTLGPDGSAFADVTVRPIPVPHRAEFSRTNAFSVAVDDIPWCLYLPDIDDWGAWPDAEVIVAGHELCLIDATFGSPDELPDRDLSRIPHPFVTDTIERFADLTDATTLVLTHINHSNDLNDEDSELVVAARDAGFTIAYDGMTFDRDQTDD